MAIQLERNEKLLEVSKKIENTPIAWDGAFDRIRRFYPGSFNRYSANDIAGRVVEDHVQTVIAEMVREEQLRAFELVGHIWAGQYKFSRVLDQIVVSQRSGQGSFTNVVEYDDVFFADNLPVAVEVKASTADSRSGKKRVLSAANPDRIKQRLIPLSYYVNTGKLGFLLATLSDQFSRVDNEETNFERLLSAGGVVSLIPITQSELQGEVVKRQSTQMVYTFG